MNAPLSDITVAKLMNTPLAERIEFGHGKFCSHIWEARNQVRNTLNCQALFAFKLTAEDRRALTRLKDDLDQLLSVDDRRCT